MLVPILIVDRERLVSGAMRGEAGRCAALRGFPRLHREGLPEVSAGLIVTGGRLVGGAARGVAMRGGAVRGEAVRGVGFPGFTAKGCPRCWLVLNREPASDW